MKQVFKRSTLAAAMLATSPAWAKSGSISGGGDTVGKSSLGHNQLSLETTPGYNATICATDADTETKSGTNITPNELNLAVDPFAGSRIEVVFTVSDVLAQQEDNVLLLLYSSGVLPSSPLPTPRSKKPLLLNLAALEFLAVYHIPEQEYLVVGPTRIGAANPSPRSKVSFSVNLDTGVLPTFIENSESAYLQAALLPRADYEIGKYETMILSEVETINFVKYSCPEDSTQSMSIGQDGSLNIENTSNGGNSITIETTKEKQATTKTK